MTQDSMQRPDSDPVEVPLTYGQHLLRFLETLHPGGAFGSRFTMMETYELSGALDYDALQWALDRVVERHDALRSQIVDDGEGVPYQQFYPPMPARLEIADLPPSPDEERVQVIEDFVNEVQDKDHPNEPPLLWAWVRSFAPDDHILVLVLHRSVSDAWSMEISLRDISAYYNARITGNEPDLEPIGLPRVPRDDAPAGALARMSYAEFAEDEQLNLGARVGGALAYWETKLDGMEVPMIPLDRDRPDVGTERKAHVLLRLPEDLQDEIVAFSRAQRATIFMTVLAGYKIYLNRLTGQTDIAVPTQTAGRTRVEVEDTVGFFLNALLLRTDLSGNPTYATVLDRVRTTCLEAFTNEIPVLMILDHIPDLGAHLADDRFVLMPFQHVRIPPMASENHFGGPVYYTPFKRDPARAVQGIALPMDTLFTVRWVGKNMLVSINYSVDLFDESTIKDMARGFVDGLERLIRAPDATI